MNLFVKYFLLGIAEVFPDVRILEKDIPVFEIEVGGSQLFHEPLKQLAASPALPLEREIDEAYLRSRSHFLARIDRVLVGSEKPSQEFGEEARFRVSVDMGQDSVVLVHRPMAFEIEILAGYLLALASVGILVSLRAGKLSVEEAEWLSFLPRASSIFGRIPFGSHLVCANDALLSDLFCSPPGPLDPEYLEGQIDVYMTGVASFVENVQANCDLDPRWALTARVARTLVDLQTR